MKDCHTYQQTQSVCAARRPWTRARQALGGPGGETGVSQRKAGIAAAAQGHFCKHRAAPAPCTAQTPEQLTAAFLSDAFPAVRRNFSETLEWTCELKSLQTAFT